MCVLAGIGNATYGGKRGWWVRATKLVLGFLLFGWHGEGLCVADLMVMWGGDVGVEGKGLCFGEFMCVPCFTVGEFFWIRFICCSFCGIEGHGVCMDGV